jgi:predicted aspartyl protease
MQMAQGKSSFDIYVGKVQIVQQEFEILICVGKEVSEILLGRQWLKTRRLVVDRSKGILTLGTESFK